MSQHWDDLLLVVMAIGVVLAVLIPWIRRRSKVGRWQTWNPRSRDTRESWPFASRRVLSEPEQVLYFRLVRALPECIVLAQVQLSHFLHVKKGFGPRAWNERIEGLSVDFLVCLKDSTIVAAVELDDGPPGQRVRSEPDARKEKALESAGIALFRWSADALPTNVEIRLVFTR